TSNRILSVRIGCHRHLYDKIRQTLDAPYTRHIRYLRRFRAKPCKKIVDGSSGEPELMEDAAHCTLNSLIVGVDRFWVVGPTSGTERPGGSQQGLDRFVSKNDQRGHRSETGGEGL